MAGLKGASLDERSEEEFGSVGPGTGRDAGAPTQQRRMEERR